MGWYLRPSLWTATIFKNFLIVPLKATVNEKFTYTLWIEIVSFAPHYYDGGRPQITRKNRFASFYLPLLLGSRSEAKNLRTYCPLGPPNNQFSSRPGSFPDPVAIRRTNFSPVRAEDGSDFTSMRRRMISSLFLKGWSENF
jgi:hypothetical protein